MTMPNRHAPFTDCAAVILAGGLNSRMGGRNKAFLDVGGASILNRLLGVLTGFFTEILLVTRKPELYADFPVRVVTDIYEARSSLTGIHAGLKQAGAGFALVTPCDAPFVQPGLIRLLLSEMTPDVDVLVPENAGRYEPLCAIYSKRCIPFIEDQLNRQDFKIYHFFREVHLKTLPAEKIRAVDARMLSFFNVNTPDVYQASQDLSKSG